MKGSPGESRVTDDTTGLLADPWRGRWHRPVVWLGWPVSSSLGLSLPERKNPSENATENAIRDVTGCKRPNSRGCALVLVQRSTSGWGAVFPSGCGQSSIRASGGWVKARQRSEASSPEHRERSDRPRSEVSEVPGSRRRSLSVTCYLRRFPSPASRFLAGRDAKTPKSGVKR
jgi:hypothetical protein